MTTPGGLDTERDGEVGLAGAGWAEEDHVLGFVQEVELREMRHGLGLDGALEREVEVVEGLDLGEPGGFDAVLTAVGLSGGDFLGEHRGEIGLVVPAFVGGTLRHRLGARGDAWCFHGAGQERELRRSAAHRTAPTAAS